VIRVDGLDGRVAVVTGAGRGIGQAIAEALLANGARVAALDLEAPAHPGILGVACDVSDEEAVDRAFTQVESELGTVSVIVLNAGIFPVVPFVEMTREIWDRTIAINLTGAFLCAHRVIGGMRAQRYGRIVAIGSSAGKSGGAKAVAAYAASKAGIMAMTKSIANEFAREGITANALAPSLIDTPMIAGSRELMERIPVGRFGKPEEVAALVCFLASEDAAYITGEVTDINGGFLID
jgi:3-oxoacyl-[acyl-carrier protein] reductase